jgi:SAM-dependent MidA family methyltransferase
MPLEPTPLAAILKETIRAHGPITFAEYMDACLYHPEHGYYTMSHQQPRRDYFTNVDASPIYGRLLTRQFQQMWTELGRPTPFMLVEAGAGTGALARQVLDFAAVSWPEFYAATEYVAVERSGERRMVQAGSLEAHMARGRFAPASTMPEEIQCGCIFSNELFDAMLVHRVVCESGALRELYVAISEHGLIEQAGPLSSPDLTKYCAEQGITLEEGQQAEVCLEACRWIEKAARSLSRGFVLTIDYGHAAQQLYHERHMRGTLLAYSRHRANEDYFRAPGEQDLTAHVNFTALEAYGGRGGLILTGCTSQTNFMLALARQSNFEDIESAGMDGAQRTRARLLFKTLIYPEGMGETFQVLVQHKGIESPRVVGLEPL